MAIVTNAHNSITDVVEVEKYVGALQSAAARSLQMAVTQPFERFMVGAATVYPKEFTMYEALGKAASQQPLFKSANRKPPTW